MKIDRRRFIELTGMAGLALVTPVAFANTPRHRVAVFVELSGGNDGLNTVIPKSDPLYAQLRPNIQIPANQMLGLDADTALHPSLKQLAGAWSDGELAIVEGLGYPEPNRSHFRSIEIWEQGTGANNYASQGWIARVAPSKALENLAPPALAVGGGGDGPLAGAHALEIDEPKRLTNMTRRLRATTVKTSNPGLAHVLRTQNELLAGVSTVGQYAARAPDFDAYFKGSRQLRPLAVAAELIASGMPLLAVKIRIGGFDTHVNQVRTHERLMGMVDEGLGAFRKAMKSVGMWDDVIVVTYSEFGRRPKENGGGGTDHGTAAPHLVLGGKVRGGRFGARPRLDALDSNGDLKYTTDFRAVYNTLDSKWWGFESQEFKTFKALRFLA